MSTYKREPLASQRHLPAPSRIIGRPASSRQRFQISGVNPEFFSGLAVAVPVALGLWLGMAQVASLIF